MWIVQLRDGDGVVLGRAEVPDVQLDPIALFGGDAPGPGRVMHVRREDGSETLFPINTNKPICFRWFDRSMLT